MRIACNCCDGPEPAEGWPYQAPGSGDLEPEVYCSKACFDAHIDHACPCFDEPDPDDDL
jgi:hypothetical protein